MLWLAGFFFLILRKLVKRAKKDWAKFVAYALLALGVFALAFAPLPFVGGSLATWAAQLGGWLLGLLGGVVGVSVAVLAGAGLILLLGFTLWDLRDKKPDGTAKAAVFVAPVLALLASGPIATGLLTIVHVAGGVGPEVLSTIT